MTSQTFDSKTEINPALSWVEDQMTMAGGYVQLTVSEVKSKRSVEQNRLQRMWCNEIASQLCEDTPEGIRGYSKAHFGVPIMCEDDEWCESYDRLVRPLSYENKIALMMKPIDFPITRDMSVDQKTRYLDAMRIHFEGRGCRLTK